MDMRQTADLRLVLDTLSRIGTEYNKLRDVDCGPEDAAKVAEKLGQAIAELLVLNGGNFKVQAEVRDSFESSVTLSARENKFVPALATQDIDFDLSIPFKKLR